MNNLDVRSELERQWDEYKENPYPKSVVDLINILKKERDAWLFNARQLQKQNNELIEENKSLRNQVNILFT